MLITCLVERRMLFATPLLMLTATKLQAHKHTGQRLSHSAAMHCTVLACTDSTRRLITTELLGAPQAPCSGIRVALFAQLFQDHIIHLKVGWLPALPKTKVLVIAVFEAVNQAKLGCPAKQCLRLVDRGKEVLVAHGEGLRAHMTRI